MIEIAGGILLAVFALYVVLYLIGHDGGGSHQMTRAERRAWELQNPEPFVLRMLTWTIVAIFGFGITMAIADHLGLLS